MLYLIVKILDIVEYLLEHFVNISVTMTEDLEHQWSGTILSQMTEKGDRLLGSLSTIIDNSMIMIAQLSTMFPAALPVYNTF